MVMPRSRSRSIESMTRSLTSWLARKAPDCQSIASTSVVLPWSTWATMATLRRSSRRGMRPGRIGGSDPGLSLLEHGLDRDQQLRRGERLLHERRRALLAGAFHDVVLRVAR